MNDNIFNIISTNRDAVATNRGFYFQYLTTLKKWVSNFIDGTESTLYTEVGDDIKEVGNCLIFTQVKCYTNSFSLQSKEVKKALYHFFCHYLKEMENLPNLKFVFETNSTIGKNEKILKKWIEEQSLLSPETMQMCCDKVRSILKEESNKIRNSKLGSSNLTKEKAVEIKKAFEHLNNQLVNNEVLQNYINGIRWNFSKKLPEKAIIDIRSEILEILKNEKFQMKPIDVLLDAFLSEIYRCAQNNDENERVLTNAKITFLLQKTESQLNDIVEKRLLILFQARYEMLMLEVKEMQRTQHWQSKRIDTLEQASKNQINLNALPKDLTNVPTFNASRIIGRSEEIKDIHFLISENKIVALNGTGGIGKSSVAELYVKNYYSSYDHIIWLNVDEDLQKTIVLNKELTYNLNLDQTNLEDIEFRFHTIVQHLSKMDGNNLFILNNLQTNSTFLSQILSNLKKWNFIISSRSTLQGLKGYKIHPLNFENAKKVFEFHAANNDFNDELLRELFGTIDYNTLLIELISKTISQSLDLTIEKVIELFKNQKIDDPELQLDIEMENEPILIQIYPFLTKAFELYNLTDSEKHFLYFLALLPPDETKINDLIELCGKDYETANKTTITNLVNSLNQKGWIERNGNSIKIYRLIQESIIYNERKLQNAFLTNLLYITWLYHRLSEGYQSNPSASFQFLKYGESILRAIKEPFRISISQPLLLLENEILVVYNWLSIGDGILARWQDLVHRASIYLPNDDPALGKIYNNYGLVLLNFKKYDDALIYFEKSIEILKKDNSKEAPPLISPLINLLQLYLETRNFTSATKTIELILKDRKDIKLINHQSMGLLYNTIGVANQNFGKFEKAIEYFKMAIKEHEMIEIQTRNDINLTYYYFNILFNLYLLDEKTKISEYLNKIFSLLDELNLWEKAIKFKFTNPLILICEEIGESEKAYTLKSRLN